MRPFDRTNSSRGSMSSIQKVPLNRSNSTSAGFNAAIQTPASATTSTNGSTSGSGGTTNSPNGTPRKPAKPQKPAKPGSSSVSNFSSSSLASSSTKDCPRDQSVGGITTNNSTTSSTPTPPSYRRSTMNVGLPSGSGGMGFMAFLDEPPVEEEKKTLADEAVGSKTGAVGFMSLCDELPPPQEEKSSQPPAAGTPENKPQAASKSKDKPAFSKVFSKNTRRPTMIVERTRNTPPVPSPELMEALEEEPDIKYNIEGDGRKVIKAATVARLVKELTQDEVADPQLRDSFLITYRAFVSPVDLLDHLMTRYEPSNMSKQPALAKRRVRVAGTVKAWLEQYFNDFMESEELQKNLLDFLDSMSLTLPTSAEGMKKIFHKLKDKAEKEKKEKEAKEEEEGLVEETDEDLFETAPAALKEEAEGLHNEGWLHLPEGELAQQMTKVESEIFTSILPKEYLAWNKKNREVLAPNISRMVRHFNELSNWVRTQMVTIVRKEGRVKMLQKFIRLMEELLKLNNLNGMMEILSGINSSPVRRMKKTFEGLGKPYTKRFKVIEDLLTHNHSYRNYRKHLHSIIPPCIPYLGVCLTDLTFILDGNPDYVEDELVHFFKWRKVSEIIVELKGYQTVQYPIVSSPGVSLFLRTLPSRSHDEDKCYDWSTKVEPKNQKAHEKLLLKLIHQEEDMKEKVKEMKRKEEELTEKLELLKSAPSLYVCLWEFVGEEGKRVKVEAGDLISPIDLITPEWGLFKTKNGEKVYIPRNYLRRAYPRKELVDEFLAKERKDKADREREEKEKEKREKEEKERKEKEKKEKALRKKERERKRKEKEKKKQEKEKKRLEQQQKERENSEPIDPLDHPISSPSLSSCSSFGDLTPRLTPGPSLSSISSTPQQLSPSIQNSEIEGASSPLRYPTPPLCRTPSPAENSCSPSSRSKTARPRSPSSPNPQSKCPSARGLGKEAPSRSTSSSLPKFSSQSSIIRMSSQKVLGGIKKSGSALKMGSGGGGKGERPTSSGNMTPLKKISLPGISSSSSSTPSSLSPKNQDQLENPHQSLIDQLQEHQLSPKRPPSSLQFQQEPEPEQQQKRPPPARPGVAPPKRAPARPERPDRLKSPGTQEQQPESQQESRPQPQIPQQQSSRPQSQIMRPGGAGGGMRLKLGKKHSIASVSPSPSSPSCPSPSSPASPTAPSSPSVVCTPRGGKITIIGK